MKHTILATLALLGATGAHAAVVPGYSDVTHNGGGSYTFFFDTLPGPDIDGTGMGLGFTGAGAGSAIDLIATSAQGRVRQDVPAHGGLGVLGSSGTDNLETGLGETLLLSFNLSVDILSYTFNGLLANDGHSDAADGHIVVSSGGSISGDASLFDGVGLDFFSGGTTACTTNAGFCGTTALLFGGGSSTFKGYLESVTVRRSAPGGPNPVPVPASLGFLFAGMAGLAFVGRRKRKS